MKIIYTYIYISQSFAQPDPVLILNILKQPDILLQHSLLEA